MFSDIIGDFLAAIVDRRGAILFDDCKCLFTTSRAIDLGAKVLRQLHGNMPYTAGATMHQVIIAWMLHSDPFVLPIIAGSRVEQVKENLAALNISLSNEQMERLNTAGNPNVKKAWLR